MIELYIENKKIDLSDDFEVNFTYEEIDPEKLSSIKNSFSKTINIPGTPNNNHIFGYIFRFDKYLTASEGTKIEHDYDPHKKVNWVLTKNGSTIHRGYCTLDNIVTKSDLEITYQMTLYGGLGEFFYSLAYNEDGSPKTLYDMFWNWIPKIDTLQYGTATTPLNENDTLLYYAIPANVAEAYHKLSPLTDTSSTTYIDQDVVFVPCYTGLYEDFDSKTMLVNTTIQNYNTTFIDPTKRQWLMQSFPDSFEQGGKTYRTMDRNFNQPSQLVLDKYGLVTFSRDLDPFEAGELRINELPIAIRLSKLMNVISNPSNNGGYTVEWDQDITSSPYWNYGWLMLDKITQDESEQVQRIEFNSQNTSWQNNLDWDHTTHNGTITITTKNIFNDVLDQGAYEFIQTFTPSTRLVMSTQNRDPERWTSMCQNIIHITGSGTLPSYDIIEYFKNTNVKLTLFKQGSTFIYCFVDVFFYNNGNDNLTFNDADCSSLSTRLVQRLQDVYHQTISIDQMNVHRMSTDNTTITTIVYDDQTLNQIDTKYDPIELKYNVEIQSYDNLEIQQLNYCCWTHCTHISTTQSGQYESGIYRYDSRPAGTQSRLDSYISVIDNNVSRQMSFNDTPDHYTFTFQMYENGMNGLYLTTSSGWRPLQIHKKELFANTQSPMKYLADFCKMMNYRFICDDTEKTIHIKELKNYYINNIIDLSEEVDQNRDINIKPITSQYKNINVGLQSIDTYPISLFNKKSPEKFNTKKYSTNIDYYLPDTELLNDLIFQNTLDWQQSSIFYKIYPQMPKAYYTTTVAWSLFYQDQNDSSSIQKSQIFTLGVPTISSTVLSSPDWFPKNALFNKENKMEDIECTLLFLNGFVKNYSYSLVEDQGASPEYTALTPYKTDTNHTFDASGNLIESTLESIRYYYYTWSSEMHERRFVTINVPENLANNTYVINYFRQAVTGMVWLGGQYTKADVHNDGGLVHAELNIPAGTDRITVVSANSQPGTLYEKTINLSDLMVISPRLLLSIDNYDQYYLNQDRCYQYDFNYNKRFVSWGYYDNSNQSGSASSWVLPMFCKDLYNQCTENGWAATEYKLASWNMISQTGLDSLYNLSSTDFIKDPRYNYRSALSISNYDTSNEYKILNIPQDQSSGTTNSTRIFDSKWLNYLDDLYDRNARIVTLYVDLSKLGDPNDIMRYIYSWRSHLWVISKIENFKVTDLSQDKFSKVTLHKIKNLSTWTKIE